MASTEGYSAIPSESNNRNIDETSANQTNNQPTDPESHTVKDGYGTKLKNWWSRYFGASEAETAPLINRSRMTLEAPRKNPVRVALEIVLIVGVFLIFSAIVLVWFGASDDNQGIHLSQKFT